MLSKLPSAYPSTSPDPGTNPPLRAQCAAGTSSYYPIPILTHPTPCLSRRYRRRITMPIGSIVKINSIVGFLNAPLLYIDRIYKFPPLPTFTIMSWKERASTATWFCVCSRLTSFAAQIPTLIWAASVNDTFYVSCVNILILYASAAVSGSVFCATYFSDSIHTFSALLLSPWSASLCSALSFPLFLI